MNADKLKQIGLVAGELGKLKQHDSWPTLRRVVEAKYDRWKTGTMKRLLAGSEFEQRDFDYQRGFWAGAFYVLDNPDKAEDSLNAALRKATTLEEGDTA